MNTTIARDFLTRCFKPGETIAILLRSENPASVVQRIVRLEQALSARYLAWLRYENHNGANVYVAANPLRAGSRKRTKDCIAEVRHLYIDIDVDGDERVTAVRTSDAVPIPTAILSTSPNKYQVLWRVEGFDFDQQEEDLKLLTIAFGGDPACTDRNRVLRVPGFHNRKYDPAHTVTVEYLSDASYHPDDFRLIGSAVVSAPTPRGVTRNYPSYKNTRQRGLGVGAPTAFRRRRLRQDHACTRFPTPGQAERALLCAAHCGHRFCLHLLAGRAGD